MPIDKFAVRLKNRLEKKLHDINLINRHAILTVICACACTETRSCAKFSEVCTQPHNIR